MGEIASLGRARKTKARAEAKAKAAENRVKFGRTKVQKAQDEARRAKARGDLDGAKRER